MNWKTGLAGLSLGVGMLFTGAGTARADDCFRRLQREELQLRRDIGRHGFYSRQADHRRQRIERLRWQCSGFRGGDRRWDQGRGGRGRHGFDHRWNSGFGSGHDRRWDRNRGFGRGFGFSFGRHRHNHFCRH